MVGQDTIRKALLEGLRRQISKTATFPAYTDRAKPLGLGEVDACLHDGLAGALHEITAADHRSAPAAVGFLLALSTTAQAKGMFLWPVAKHADAFGAPYPPGLKFFGLDPARVVFVHCANARECMWAMEEGLRLGGIAAVIASRTKKMDLTASRRLQLAAEHANSPVFLLHAYNDHAPSAAVTRWRVSPAPSARDEFGFYKNARFRVALDYARNGKTGEWVMEWDRDALRLRLSSVLGDRTAGENRAA